MPLVIGLIGGIGSGKSEVSGMLAAKGAIVIVADAVGHELLKDPEVRDQILSRFGADVMTGQVPLADPTPGIDRRALGAIVFADPTARRGLEEILHPRMRARFASLINQSAQADQPGPRWIVLDAAILLEASWDDLCDQIVFVDAPRAQRVRRVVDERGWSEEALESRERAQWPIAEKRRRADFIITNDAGLDHLSREVDRLLAFLLERTRPAAARLGCCLEVGADGTNPGPRDEPFLRVSAGHAEDA
jgi:dephospho-CoA kinase